MPGEMPTGWRSEPLGKLGQFVKCQGGSKKDEVPSGVPVVRYGHLYTRYDTVIRDFFSFVTEERASDYTPLKAGDVLFAGSGETLEEIGKAAVFLGDAPAHGSGDLILLRPSPAIDPLFLGYSVNGGEANDQKMRLGQGSSVFHISADRLAGLRIQVPPLPEQKKIAAILSSVDAAIQATQAVIDQTRRVKEGLLQDLLTRGLPGHTRFKQTEIGEIPESWEVRPLEAVLERLIDYRGKPPPKANDGIPLLTAKNVREGYINPEPREFIPHDMWDEWMVRGLPQVGDVLFTTEAPLGMVAMLLTDRVALGQRLLCLRSAPSVYHGGFLLQVLLSSGFQGRCASRATGSTALGIKQSTFRQMLVPVPPLSEQKLVAEIVGQVAATQSQAETDIAGLRRLKTGLLQDLLTGKVRVSP